MRDIEFHLSFGSLLLLLLGTSFTYGQKPTPSPTEKPRTFGWSLEKYDKKKTKNSGKVAPPATSNNSPVDDEIKVETDLVINDVLVSNQKGSIIKGLKKEDFAITEDGIPQKLELFSSGENKSLPRSIVLVIDKSPGQSPYFDESIGAAKVLVEKLNENDRMAIVTDDLKLRLDFTSDKNLLKKTLDSLEWDWGMNIEFESLFATLNEMFDKDDRLPTIVFQGDGVHAIWLKADGESPYPVSYSTLERSGLVYTKEKSFSRIGFGDIRRGIESSRATVYSIITGPRFLGVSKEEQLEQAKLTLLATQKEFKTNTPVHLLLSLYQAAEAERRTAGQAAMFKVAELSGGTADFIEKPEDAQNVYSNIFTIMSNRYSLGYYPTNQSRDGKRREVKIEVKGHPEFVVTTRKAYTLQ